MEKCKYISIAGAASKGLMYAGALESLETHMSITGTTYETWRQELLGIAGTSAGSIVGLLIILGTELTIREKYISMMSSMQDLLPCPDISLLISYYGWESGTAFKSIIQELLMDSGLSPDSTLGDLKRLLRKEFVCVATDLQTCKPIILSSSTDPTLRVCDAIFMSCALPFVFKPMIYKEHLIVDGCMSCNLPQVFPPNLTAFWYVSYKDQTMPIHNWPDFVQNIVYCAINSQYKFLPTEGTMVKFAMTKDLNDRPAFDLHMDSSLVQMYKNMGSATMTDVLYNKNLTRCVQFIILTLCQMHLQENERDHDQDQSEEFHDF